jgi:hypothetical protein
MGDKKEEERRRDREGSAVRGVARALFLELSIQALGGRRITTRNKLAARQVFYPHF